MANVSQVKAQFATDITATATATIAALQTLGGAGNMTLTGGSMIAVAPAAASDLVACISFLKPI